MRCQCNSCKSIAWFCSVRWTLNESESELIWMYIGRIAANLKFFEKWLICNSPWKRSYCVLSFHITYQSWQTWHGNGWRCRWWLTIGEGGKHKIPALTEHVIFSKCFLPALLNLMWKRTDRNSTVQMVSRDSKNAKSCLWLWEKAAPLFVWKDLGFGYF